MNITCFGSGSKGNSYLISTGDSNILIDAGISLKKMANMVGWGKLTGIDACLITHEHRDHAKYIEELLSFGLTVYMTEGTAVACKSPTTAYNNLRNLRFYHFAQWDTFDPLPIKDVIIYPIVNIHHDAKEPVNYRIDGKDYSLVYITDTAKVDNDKHFYKCLTHIMIEANYEQKLLDEQYEAGEVNSTLYKRIMNNHLSIEQTLEWLSKTDLSKVEEIHLLHLSNKNSDAADFKERVQKLTGKETYIEEGKCLI